MARAGGPWHSPSMSEAHDNAGHLYLVDGSGYLFRAYHALPPLTREDGTPVNAVLGFCNMIEKLLGDLDDSHSIDGDGPTHMAVIFDAGRVTFRNEIYAAYKANRPEPPEDLVPQFDLVRDASRAFDLATIELAGFEADDLIASYAKAAEARGMKVTIVSSDKDLMQLVRGRIGMFDPIKQRRIGETEVMERFGVAPDRVVDVQALAGDSTDNVPGVPGIGVKTAAELINTFGDLDTLLVRAAEIKQPKRRQTLLDNAEMARVSRELVRLRDDCPLDPDLDGLAVRDRDLDLLLAFLKAQGFRSLSAKLLSRLDDKTLIITPREPITVIPLELAMHDPKLRPDGTLAITFRTAETGIGRLLEKARAAGIGIADLSTKSPDLEDVFMALTGDRAPVKSTG